MENTVSETIREAHPQVSAGSTAKLIREVRRAPYRKYTAEEKIRIVLEGFRMEIPISDLCRMDGIAAGIYYKWLKDFMEVGKSRLKGDSLRESNRDEVEGLKRENERLKRLVGEHT